MGTVVVVGGGPAGMVLGLLLARAGVQVTVCEKHADFLRDFRGDTVHASTIRLLDELGLGKEFRALPQSRLQNFEVPQPDGSVAVVGDFSTLKPPYDYVAMVPQWDLLDLLASAAQQEAAFTLRMSTGIAEVVVADGRAVGVRTEAGEQIDADLVVACDGRSSILRRQAGLVPHSYAVPFDTWWFRVPRPEAEHGTPGSLQPVFGGHELLLSIPRSTYLQLAYFAEKGTDAELRAQGVESFRRRIARLRPDLVDRVAAVGSMDEVHHLDVRLDRLHRWHRPGLLCIGDAAHAMSPAGGVGINLAVQDAVAAATLLAEPLRTGRITERHLARVQRRRWWPTVVLQTLQRALHRVIFSRVIETGRPPRAPRVMQVLTRWVPGFSTIPARLIALGPLPEHAPAFARRPPSDPPRPPRTP